jgi:hypothetical protein
MAIRELRRLLNQIAFCPKGFDDAQFDRRRLALVDSARFLIIILNDAILAAQDEKVRNWFHFR